jgi:FdhD protein
MISIRKITEGIRTFLDNISSKEMQRNGVHTSILINNNQVLYCSNDIGRHNTLDKISGFCLINSIEITNSMLITTGRISSDMVIKSLRMKVPVVISLHSASVAAQELAVENGLILICHARKPEFTVLGGFERIQLTD